MPKFLIGHKHSTLLDMDEIKIVDVEDESQAIGKYLRKYTIKEASFLKYVYGRITNGSFCETFWMATDEEQDAWNENMEILIDDTEFQRRVREFFSERQDFADLYLQNYYREDDIDHIEYGLFPEEMLIWLVYEGNWTDFVVIPLDEIPEL
jgi:hypothetical protein